MAPMIKTQIARLKKPAEGKADAACRAKTAKKVRSREASAATAGNDQTAVAKRLDKLEHLMQEMNDRLKSIETRLPPPK